MDSLANDKSFKAKRVRTSRKPNVSSTSKKIAPEPIDDIFNELDNLVEEIKKEEERLSQLQNQKKTIVEEKTSASTRKSTEKIKAGDQKKGGKGKGRKKKTSDNTNNEDSDFEVSKPKKTKTSVANNTDRVNGEIGGNDNSMVANAKGKKGKKGKNADKKTPVMVDDKPAKKGGESTDDVILEYLKSTNRPYSLINIFDNLKGKIKKPVIQKSLDDLAEKELISKKDFKKMTVYYFNQRSIVVDQQIISDCKKGLDTIKEEYNESAALNKELKSKLNGIEKEETTENIRKLVNQLSQEVPALNKKLNIFKNKDEELIPEHIVDEKMKSVETLEAIKRKRRKIFKTIIDTIQEQTGMKTDELYETLGIEPLTTSRS